MSSSTKFKNEIVCVTGANGFIGSHVVKILLEEGYTVRGTVRDPSNELKIKHLTCLPFASERLSLHSADLLQEGSFDTIFQDCIGIFHTASPFFLKNSSRENLLIPAIKGTLNVLESIKKCPSIKRVILTSSTAAVYADFGSHEKSYVYSEKDWSNVEKLEEHQCWYALGKTMAERSAIEFVENLGSSATFDLISINPTWVFGPILQSTINESTEKIVNYLKGIPSKIPNEYKTYVDVRNVAWAHVLAYQNSQANGRYLLIDDSPFEQDVCKKLKEICPNSQVPQELSLQPSSLIPIYGPTQPTKICFNNQKARDLGIEFIGMDKMLLDTVTSLREHQIIDC